MPPPRPRPPTPPSTTAPAQPRAATRAPEPTHPIPPRPSRTSRLDAAPHVNATPDADPSRTTRPRQDPHPQHRLSLNVTPVPDHTETSDRTSTNAVTGCERTPDRVDGPVMVTPCAPAAYRRDVPEGPARGQ